jgi:hypothetical protein
MLIEDNQRMMVREIVAHLGIGHYAFQRMIATLGYQKVCSQWVPYLLMDEHKKTHMSSQLLQQDAAKDDDSLFSIMTGGGSWFDFNPEIK